MVTLSELWRRVQNMVVTARVEETMASDGKMLVRVRYTDKGTGEEHLSKWLPVATKNNSLMKVWMPVLAGEQVTVFRPFGDNDGGVVFTSIHWSESKEPDGANEHIAIVKFNDGCTVSYDTETKELFVKSMELIHMECIRAKVNASESVDVIAPKVTVECDTAKVTATNSTTVVTPLVTLDCDELHVTGDTQIDGDLTADGSLNIGETATIDGSTEIGSTLDVEGIVSDYMGVLSNFITSNGGTRVS